MTIALPLIIAAGVLWLGCAVVALVWLADEYRRFRREGRE